MKNGWLGDDPFLFGRVGDWLLTGEFLFLKIHPYRQCALWLLEVGAFFWGEHGFQQADATLR